MTFSKTGHRVWAVRASRLASTPAGRSALVGTRSGPRYSSTEYCSAPSMLPEPASGPAPMTSDRAEAPGGSSGSTVTARGSSGCSGSGSTSMRSAVRAPTTSWTSAASKPTSQSAGGSASPRTARSFTASAATPPHRKTNGIIPKHASSWCGPRPAGSNFETHDLRDRVVCGAHRPRVGATDGPAASQRVVGGARRWTGTRPHRLLRVYRRRRRQRAEYVLQNWWHRVGPRPHRGRGVRVARSRVRVLTGRHEHDGRNRDRDNRGALVPQPAWFFLQRRRRPGGGAIHRPRHGRSRYQ